MPDIYFLIIIGYSILEFANALASLNAQLKHILLILEFLISVFKIVIYGHN
jgi:hypothetical protein